jgi:hypothetical protein
MPSFFVSHGISAPFRCWIPRSVEFEKATTWFVPEHSLTLLLEMQTLSVSTTSRIRYLSARRLDAEATLCAFAFSKLVTTPVKGAKR